MPVITDLALHAYAIDIFRAIGSNEAEARLIADHLIEANLVGHDSHGVGLIPLYLRFAAEGQVNTNQHATVVRTMGAVSVVDGNRGFGQVIAHETMLHAIDQAAAHGVSLTALRNSFHVGRIGHWAEQCARAGFASMHFVNVIGHDPLVAPFGGRDARFATNPVCIAVPGESGVLSILDMATSKIALGKARVAMRAGAPAPPGTLIDAAGEATTDPGVMFADPQGALLAMGEHKGSGLAIMVELLAGALGGGTTMQPAHPRPGGPVNGMLSIVIDPDAISGRSYLADEGRKFLDYVKAARPARGTNAVLTPGEPERHTRHQRSAAGIPLSDGAWHELTVAAGAIGVRVPPPVAGAT